MEAKEYSETAPKRIRAMDLDEHEEEAYGGEGYQMEVHTRALVALAARLSNVEEELEGRGRGKGAPVEGM